MTWLCLCFQEFILTKEIFLELKMTSPLGSTADCFSGWANYPINIANQDDLIPSAASLNDRLTRLTKTLFSSTVDLHLIGIKSDGILFKLSKTLELRPDNV